MIQVLGWTGQHSERWVLGRLSNHSKQLEEKSDSLNFQIESLNKQLEAMNIGLEVWLSEEGLSSGPETSRFSLPLFPRFRFTLSIFSAEGQTRALWLTQSALHAGRGLIPVCPNACTGKGFLLPHP
jgi:hypothetical protein